MLRSMTTRMLQDRRMQSIAGMYLFFIAGGVWHILNLFQELMAFSAGAVMITLPLWVWWECYQKISACQKHEADYLQVKKYFRNGSILVICLTWGIEWFGAHTGIVFGEYTYQGTLRPAIMGVPLAMGFAWLGLLLGAVALLQRVFPGRQSASIWKSGMGVAFIMVCFDVIMEPAAIKLNYWIWKGDAVPLHNYIGWFMISLGFSSAGYRYRLFENKLPGIALHAFFAQFIYFGLVVLKSLLS